jgi:hypothetical protein
VRRKRRRTDSEVPWFSDAHGCDVIIHRQCSASQESLNRPLLRVTAEYRDNSGCQQQPCGQEGREYKSPDACKNSHVIACFAAEYQRMNDAGLRDSKVLSAVTRRIRIKCHTHIPVDASGQHIRVLA